MALRKVDLMLILLVFLVASTVASSHAAQSKPVTLAELALYQGADREKILLDGAKKEGQLTFSLRIPGLPARCPRSSKKSTRSSRPMSGAAIPRRF